MFTCLSEIACLGHCVVGSFCLSASVVTSCHVTKDVRFQFLSQVSSNYYGHVRPSSCIVVVGRVRVRHAGKAGPRLLAASPQIASLVMAVTMWHPVPSYRLGALLELPGSRYEALRMSRFLLPGLAAYRVWPPATSPAQRSPHRTDTMNNKKGIKNNNNYCHNNSHRRYHHHHEESQKQLSKNQNKDKKWMLMPTFQDRRLRR